LKATIDELKGTNVPIGWSRAGLQNMESNPMLWLGALLGWFLTACAASLGAPFWFDVLEEKSSSSAPPSNRRKKRPMPLQKLASQIGTHSERHRM